MMDSLWDLTTWGLLPHPYGTYAMLFVAWIVGAWVVLWWTEDQRDAPPRWLFAAGWPAVVAALVVAGAATSPVWVPLLSYRYLFETSDDDG